MRDADRLSLDDLASELRCLTDLARRDGVPAAHITGGILALNNYGPLGVDGATPILNHPQTAMLGIGRLVDRPWAVDGRVEVRKALHLSLTFDHRVCDGGAGPVGGGASNPVRDVRRRVTVGFLVRSAACAHRLRRTVRCDLERTWSTTYAPIVRYG